MIAKVFFAVDIGLETVEQGMQGIGFVEVIIDAEKHTAGVHIVQHIVGADPLEQGHSLGVLSPLEVVGPS